VEVRLFITVILTLLFPVVAFGVLPQDCLEVALMIVEVKPIARSEQLALPVEHPIAGKVWSKAQDFSRLEPGVYVYLVDETGRIAFSHRAPMDIASDERYLVTHRSLLALLNQGATKPFQIKAAGEFHVMPDGQVMRVTNQAGTFPGDSTHLALGWLALKEAGLKVGANTEAVDYSVKGGATGNHIRPETDARMRLKIEKDPELKTLVGRLYRLQRKLASEIPSLKTPGDYDRQKFSRWIEEQGTVQELWDVPNYFTCVSEPRDGAVDVIRRFEGHPINGDRTKMNKMVSSLERIVARFLRENSKSRN